MADTGSSLVKYLNTLEREEFVSIGDQDQSGHIFLYSQNLHYRSGYNKTRQSWAVTVVSDFIKFFQLWRNRSGIQSWGFSEITLIRPSIQYCNSRHSSGWALECAEMLWLPLVSWHRYWPLIGPNIRGHPMSLLSLHLSKYGESKVTLRNIFEGYI